LIERVEPDDMQARTRLRRVDGIVLLDKPAGETSNRALQRVKRIYQAAKAGHTGSLDPMATGMLPICLGTATKVSSWLLEAAKEYRVSAKFGVATDTGDADGTITRRSEPTPAHAKGVESALASMIGESEQVPPMYSALKLDGRRLYALARRGIEVERPPRRIRIDEIELERIDWPDIRFRVRCSKGTYIRSLVTDIAAKLDTIGHVTALRRTCVDPFDPEAMVSLQELEADRDADPARLAQYLASPDSALQHLPEVTVDAASRLSLMQGRAVAVPSGSPGAVVRIYDPSYAFVGLGEISQESRLQPRKIFCVDMVE
jgi:tRNA pseudouridine55 synthase